jgi:hypothetical protein
MMKWKEQLNATVRGATRDCTNSWAPGNGTGAVRVTEVALI